MADSSSVDANVITDAVDSTGATVISVVQSNVVESSRVDALITTGGIDTSYTDAQINALFRNSDITYTVGTGGNYSTINAAIVALSKIKPYYKKDGFAATINLLSGFVMAEQVFVRGVDLSWITITSVDAEVPVTTASIAAELIDLDNVTPIFGGIDNAHLPIIDTLFAYPDSGSGYATTPMDGVVVANNSQVLFKPGSGVKRPRNGLKVLYGSSATCYMPGLTQGGAGSGAGSTTGVDFSYATARAVMVSFGSKANLARSIIHHALGDYGIYVIWGSHGDFYQSQVHDTINGNAITCRDGSFANMRETNVARSVRGYHALHNARINARNHANVWSGDSAKDCTGYGILASYGSHIDASEVDVSGSDIGVNASNASSVSMQNGIAINCTTRGIGAFQGSTIDAVGVPANGPGEGFRAGDGSTINARDTTAAGCTIGYIASDDSTINANNGIATGCGIGFEALAGSTINADTSTANSCTNIGYYATETSRIQARNSSANSATNHGFHAERSSIINARGSSATGCGIGFYAYEGSDINAQSTSGASAGTWGYFVDRGSNINGGAITGTTNQAVNLRTGLGIISDSALAIPSDSTVVHIAGSETITGTKKFSPADAAGSFQVTRADGTTNVVYVDTSSSTPKFLFGVGSTPGSLVNVNGKSYFGGGSGVATSFADFAPATTASASARVRSGVDPTSPNTGDVWFDGTDLKFRNGATTQLLTSTAYVDAADALKAPLASPALTGNPTAPTQSAGDNSTKLATTSYADTGLALKAGVNDGWKVTSAGTGWSHTGDLLEATLATLTIPAGALGPNGTIRLTTNWSCTNNANTKTVRVRFSGASGTQYLNSPLTSQARLHTPMFIYNRNLETSQIGGTNAGNQAGYGQSTTGQVTSSVDTTAATTLVLTGQLGVNTDTVTLESYLLEYHYQA